MNTIKDKIAAILQAFPIDTCGQDTIVEELEKVFAGELKRKTIRHSLSDYGIKRGETWKRKDGEVNIS